jgi:hypothetical protein
MKSHQLSQEVNPNTHQHIMSHFWPAIPPTLVSHPPARHIIIVDSDTESYAKGDYPYNDEELSVVENQAGYPHEGILSSPPPASKNIGHNESNHDNNGGFHLKQRYVDEAEEGNSSGVLNTDIVLSLGNKARTNSL